MLKQGKIEQLHDYFTDLGQRKDKGVYFYRLNGYNQKIEAFLQAYSEAARQNGVIIEGKLQNPDNHQLAYYSEMMGMDFQLSPGFLLDRLKKWLPRMNLTQRQNVANAIYDTLFALKKAGKNDNMLKNAYIKFMCWLYYRFERIMNHLGEEKLPKILYAGNISLYELLMMQVLSGAGCDIVLLQCAGDAEYRKIDADSSKSCVFFMPGMAAFPADFSLKQLWARAQTACEMQKLCGEVSQHQNCTSAWMTGKPLEDVQTAPANRGNDPHLFYNCFVRLVGVEDRLTYLSTLYQLQLTLRQSRRRVVIANNTLPPPSVEEINAMRRGNVQNLTDLLALSGNIRGMDNPELQSIARKAFIDLMQECYQENANLNRLTGKAVYLLCWLRRFQNALFAGWHMPEISCFLFLNGAQKDNDALFCRFLARLPVDVLIFSPDKQQKCCLQDRFLYETTEAESMTVEKYPEENTGLRAETAAYQAERDLDTILYQDTGMFRSQQYQQANAISLQTMYEEIQILWEQELRYRPNFSVVQNTVNMPVIFAKVSGVKDSNLPQYWRSIKKLLTPDTTLVQTVPQITAVSPNLIKPFATEFYRGRRLQKEHIKQHKAYPYGVLREPMQNHLLDKLEQLIEQRYIKGTFENGTEYTIVSTALNLDRKLLRLIQKFDFTKQNPKLVYIVTGEKMLSLEDTITAAFLNLVGFDIVFFVPTGYQSIEKYMQKCLFDEHQIGEYLYDLQVPDFDTLSDGARPSWREKLFGRGL